MRSAHRAGPIPRPARDRRRARAAAGLALGAALLIAAPAGAVQVTCGGASGLAGQTVEIAVGTGDLTGLDIRSFEFDITYNANVVTAVGVSAAGTTAGAAGWTLATFGVTPGRVTVTDAGIVPLSGSGALIKVQFLINPAQLAGTSTALGLASVDFVFNEGSPLDTTANGTITVNPTPVITVSPNTGEVIRGQTLAFSVSGGVTQPVAWFTTNPAIATIDGSGLLTGAAPGSVRVFAVDGAGRRDTTNAEILVRGMGLTAGVASVIQGLTVDVPLTVTSLAGLGVRAGQVTLTYNAGLITAIGVQTPAGTLLDGYGPVGFGSGIGTCTVDFVGSTDLSGPGVLCTIRFQAGTAFSGGTALTVAQALFNEDLPARATNGNVTVQALPSISVAPDQVTLLAGATRAFSLGGSPTPPIAWSTLDPAVATIDATGLLTAVAGGVTRVRATDALGATDENTSVTVHDFSASLPTVLAPPGAKVRVPLFTDRDLTTLGIRALQYTVSFNATHVTGAVAKPSGLVGVWGASGLEQNLQPGSLRVASGGTASLGAGSNEIQVLEFTLSPAVPVGTNLPLTLSGVVFNEGRPSPLVVDGQIQVRTTADAPAGGGRELALHAAEPNPLRRSARIRFSIPAGGAAGERVRLAVYGLDGRRVRTLVDEPATPGERAAVWDARDSAGSAVPAGIYVCRLTLGNLSLSRKLAVVP